MKPLAIDLFCGLGGWTEGLLAEGYYVVGFDIERHIYGDDKYPAQLVLQDVLTIHGKQFKDAALIVASPPCQEYSYMAMPWKKAKALAAAYRSGVRDVKQLTALFDACFRIQREACEAAGRHIPLVVENVRGAIPWVGRSRWNFGSFHLWGDVPALMPMVSKRGVMKDGIAHRPNGETNFHGHAKNLGFRFDGSGRSFQSESVHRHISKAWRDKHYDDTAKMELTGVQRAMRDIEAAKDSGAKGYAARLGESTISRSSGSKSPARKAASAMIAKIPLPLAQYIARVFYPA